MAHMWHRKLHRGVMYAVMTALLGAATFGVEADGERETAALSPRVRTSTPAIAALLTQASAGTETFRRLVGTIERTDGIVYIEPGVCRHGVRACLSLSVTSGSGFRILRILVNLASDVVQLMATMGHELRHALEILADPRVRSAEDAYLFYAREAATVRDAFETRAAIQAGQDVERELKGFRRSRACDGPC